MSNQRKHDEERSRNDDFSEKTATRIWYEEPSKNNPYITSSVSCHGYDLFELMNKRSFVDVFYLLFRGELPSTDEAALLQKLMIGLINPGPRHAATRAAMTVGVGKTDTANILPIAAAVLGGRSLGGGAIEEAMRFFRKNQKRDVKDVGSQIIEEYRTKKPNGLTGEDTVFEICPGFGIKQGGVEVVAKRFAQSLSDVPGEWRALSWGICLAEEMGEIGVGWLMHGVAAAAFADLGFQPRAGASLFQVMGAPGLVAHGVELANKPITAMPYVKDEDYVIER